MVHKNRTLAGKLGAVGGALLLVGLAAIGLTLWLSWQLEGGAAAINEAGRMRMQTWRLAQTISLGDVARAAALADEFDQSIALLAAGDPSRPLFVPFEARSRAAFADVGAGWNALRPRWTQAPAAPAAEVARQAETLVARIDLFVLEIERHLARLTTLLNLVQFALIGLMLASAVAMLYSSYLFIFNPLAGLQAGLTRIREGDLSARITERSNDEFDALAEGFNRMAETLQSLYQGLESKVREKTLRLETEHARLAALYEAANFVTRATTVDHLAQGFAQQFRRVAMADASAIRWSDESNQHYILLASDGLPPSLAEAEYCIPTDNCFCGQDRAQAHAQVIAIVSQPPARRPGHCERAGYVSVLSVPIRLQERLIGELNLFYRTPVTLSDDDRALLEALASHLAGAIEGLRAAAIERESAVAEERGLIARQLHDSIAQSLAFQKIQLSLLRGALRRGDAVSIDKTLAELDEGINGSLSDVRELLVHFRTRANAEDIVPALQTTLQKFQHQSGLLTHLSIDGEGLPPDADVQVQILHVVQEALSNVRKHSGASRVWVNVRRTPPWRVEVRDDGRGFTPPAADAADGLHVGLRIMCERAQRVGAVVEILSAPGAGTRVVMTLPPPEKQALAA
ncbi:MAG: type IV pili methyl-accepting chemotaxis transducer N-terminal domain-containing protein [Burkholderiaceae bacterium]|jgi:two-component system nitrate/nitrite sensor histidine kinase NarX|nr:type IV pili methyl-accepting chemotaxis transducer N-terminal domain-containing protein [Burkholderiaceae bacterium]